MMKKIREKFVIAKNKAICKALEVREMKEAGDKALIVELVLIAIAVALVLIFKTQISKLVTDFMAKVTTKISDALG